MRTRFAGGEALAAHVAAQSDKIQGTGDEMTALQDEVTSGTATLRRVLRASEHADYVEAACCSRWIDEETI